MSLRRNESWCKSPISYRRTVLKGEPRRVPMNMPSLKYRRCRCDGLITGETYNLNECSGSCVECYIREMHRASTKWW